MEKSLPWRIIHLNNFKATAFEAILYQKELCKSLAVGLVLLISILIVKPFGIRFSGDDLFFLSLILFYSVLTSILIFINEKFLKKTFLKLSTRNLEYQPGEAFWNAYLTISILFACILLCSTLLQINSLFFFIGLKLAVFFLFPTLVVISIFLNRSKSNIDPIIDFKSENKNENFSLPLSRVYFIKCEDNYAAIYYSVPDSEYLEKRLVRTSLKNLSKRIKTRLILRCHRSFMVNLNQIRNIKGPKRNLRLNFRKSDHVIPVSRKYSADFEYLKRKTRN
ncbi:MAG: LytTR family DNA-binding domain-containing protein [Balneolaceae bacterium]